MIPVVDTVVRLVATGVARLPWKKIRTAIRETALVVAYEQGRKIGRREGFDGGYLAQEHRIETQRGLDEVASQVARRISLEQGRPSQPQQ